MIKTIKVKKQMRLDELIKYVWENDIRSETLESKFGVEVRIGGNQAVIMNHPVGRDETFTVEVEEEITEDTEFEALVFILVSGRIEVINNYHNIRSARSLFESYETEKQIYAVIDKKLELIWEAENSERN